MLVVALLARFVGVVDEPPETATQHLPTPTRGAEKQAVGDASYEALLARGFTVEETKPLLLQRFGREALSAIEGPARSYWASGSALQVERALRVLEAHDRVRTRLLEIYGTDARDDEAFQRLLRPLGPMFSFLGSEQQIAIQRLRLGRRLKMQAALERLPGAIVNGVASGRTIPAGVEEARAEFRSELERLLGEAVLFEYLLRDSPLAQRLRSSGIEFSEPEFRETYRLLQRLESTRASHETLLSVREGLRRTLGSRRFAALWASRDLRFEAVRRVGREHGLTPETILSAYEILNDAQDRMVEIVGLAAQAPQRAARETKAVRAEQQRRLAGLLGPQVAQQIIRAQAVQAFQLFQQQREDSPDSNASMPRRRGESNEHLDPADPKKPIPSQRAAVPGRDAQGVLADGGRTIGAGGHDGGLHSRRHMQRAVHGCDVEREGRARRHVHTDRDRFRHLHEQARGQLLVHGGVLRMHIKFVRLHLPAIRVG